MNGILLKFVGLCLTTLLTVMVASAESEVSFAERELPAATADLTALDLDPPVVQHQPPPQAITAGQPAVISAVVSDNRGVEAVRLRFRFSGDAEYSQQLMLGSASNAYLASVETQVGMSAIEYYLEAEDVTGNRVLFGFPHAPLVLTLSAPPAESAQSLASAPVEQPVNPPAIFASSTKGKLLYVIAGVVLVGLLVSGGSSSSSSGAGGNGSGDSVPVTFTLTPP